MSTVNWQTIRPWEDSQPNGFQALCVSLARSEAPPEARFVAKGNPDAGVECYCILPDTNEWGWQAKYFTTALTSTQWQQLDRSIKTALDKHPRLVRYYVCIPRDRSDARLDNHTSELDRWNNQVNKWMGWAQEKGMTVEFVWWGSAELLDRLSHNENIGRRFYWFGQRGFDQEWFRYHANEAVRDAGPRYTPELHIDLPIGQDLQRFSRSSFLYDDIKSHAVGIRGALRGLMAVHSSLEQPLQASVQDNLSPHTDMVLGALANLEVNPSDSLPLTLIAETAEEAAKAGNEIYVQVRNTQRRRHAEHEEDRPHRNYQNEPEDHFLYYIRRLLSGLTDLLQACYHADSLANNHLLLLNGEGGMGKTHLLCDFAQKRIDGATPNRPHAWPMVLGRKRSLGTAPAEDGLTWSQRRGVCGSVGGRCSSVELSCFDNN